MKRSKLIAEATRALYEVYLSDFARLCYEALYPLTPLDEGFHIDVVCKALQNLLAAPSGMAALNLPPRHLKSFLASVAFPLYALRCQPRLGVLILAGTQELATELLGNALRILGSEHYRRIFGDMRYDREGSSIVFATGGSIRYSVYGQNIIGRGFDLCIIDDPQSPTIAKNTKLREEANAFFDTSVRQRMNSTGAAWVLDVQQRLHDRDMTGHLRARHPGMVVTAIPAIAVEDEIWQTEKGTVTRARGEAICPARENRVQWRERMLQIGGLEFMAQCQQTPSDPSVSELQGYWYYFTAAGEADQPPVATMMLGRLPYSHFVDQSVFGVNHGISLKNPNPLTLDEWEAGAIVQQAKLLASSARAR